MAFHLHLINPLNSFAPEAAPMRRRVEQFKTPAFPRLRLEWKLDLDGRPSARWTRD